MLLTVPDGEWLNESDDPVDRQGIQTSVVDALFSREAVKELDEKSQLSVPERYKYQVFVNSSLVISTQTSSKSVSEDGRLD